jgi:uncharacterized membrane protein YkoI
MKKTIKLLGAITLLAAIVPLSAYAATSTSAPTDKAPTVAAVATQSTQNDAETADAAEQPGSETPEAAKKPEAVDPNEQAKLQQAAQITTQQATDTALKQVSGTVKEVALEDENGVVVYNVHIIDANGKDSEVKVDAKTGSITKSQADNNDGNSDGETNDGN